MRSRTFSLILLFAFFLVPALAGKDARSDTFALAWDPNRDPDLAGYRIYVSEDGENIENYHGDLFFVDLDSTSTDRSSYCVVLDGHEKLCFGVTTYNSRGRESGVSRIVYYLKGNIYGDYNDGVPYSEARVDGDDLVFLSHFFGIAVNHEVIQCSEDFSLTVDDYHERSDLDNDGDIDGDDLAILASCFGNSFDSD